MPALAPQELVNVIINAFNQSGYNAIFTSPNLRTHPRKFKVSDGNETFSVWVYIWTITHGGRKTLPDEYRIQLTSVISPLPKNPEGYTVLLGFYPDLDVFGGFDLRKHENFTSGSPSIQINISAFNDALQNGFGFSTKDNEEVAIGIRSDQLINYIVNSENLHEHGAEAAVINLLNRAASNQEINDADINGLSSDRQQIITNIKRYSRNANFRKMVINAYDNRCAITRIQLKLVEAAHILPVPVDDSSDHVTNGIALSPTMHRAYDNCLIYLDEEYRIQLNDEKVRDLQRLGIDGGLDYVRSLMNRRIHLPQDASQRPNVEYILRANNHRRIPRY